MSPLTSHSRLRNPRFLALAGATAILLLLAATAGAVYAYQQSIPATTTFDLKTGAKEVPLDQPITLSFTRPASAAAVAAHLHVAPAVEGSLKTQSSTRFAWTPDGPWADLTTYTVTVDAFKYGGHDFRGGRLAFTTTIVPRITAVTVDAGSGVADGADLPLGTKLSIAFNTQMDATSVQLTANGTPAALAWTPDSKSATLDTAGLKIGQLALAVQGGRDAAGHALSTNWKLTVDLVFKVNVHTTPLKFPALVQVPDDPTARDQSGLQSADMVFEYATEGNIPRFTAVFTSVPDKVGPVRSGRLISIKLTQHYRGELFLSGTSQGTGAVLRAAGIPAQFDSTAYYYRSGDRAAPNNLYINGDAIARAENQSGVQPGQVAKAKPSIPAGAGGAEVSVAQHDSTYHFDDTTGTYTKTQDGHTMADASIGQPLHIAMLVVMHTRVTTTSIIEDSNNAHGLDYDLDSGGAAEIYFAGQKAAGRWSAPSATSPLTFTLDNGQPVGLAPGLVWIDVIP